MSYSERYRRAGFLPSPNGPMQGTVPLGRLQGRGPLHVGDRPAVQEPHQQKEVSP